MSVNGNESAPILFKRCSCSRTRTEVCTIRGNYRNRVLKLLAKALEIPKLTLQVLRRTMATRAQNLGSVKDIQSHLRAGTTANESMHELPERVQQMVGTVYAMLTSSKACNA